MKIILFGGAFNPVHNEHVAMLKAAISAIGADKVIIMPTAVSPHKTGQMTASPAARLEMCRLAFSDLGEVSDFEVNKGGASYSYITCEYLRHKYPDDEIYFFMGADMFACFADWVYPERILKNVKVATCEREGSAGVAQSQQKFKQQFGEEALVVSYTGAAVSSTRVRTAAAIGADISAYVPAEIDRYIKKSGLYLVPELAKAQKLLTDKRAAHTLRVAFMAAENCRRLKIPEKKAVTAAALHDAAKYLKLSDKRLRGFVPPEDVPENVMHQYTGAYLAEHEFGVTDEDILNAIRYHTSGRAGMSPLEKLIFLSDLLEEGRDFVGVEALREIFSRDIDECVEAALKEQLDYLIEEKRHIYPLTQAAYDYICEYRKNKNKGNVE